MDYRDFDKSKKKNDPVEEMGKAGFWWKETDPMFRGHSLQAAAENLQHEQSARHNLNLLHARLYGNFDMVGFRAREYARGNIAASSKIAFNVVEAAVDTLASKISKQTPMIRFQTDGAKFTEQQKSKRLELFVAGGFSHARIKTKNDLVFVDACVFGTGGYKFIMIDGKVDVERVFIDELLVDEADARYGMPRQMFQEKLCHRESLLAAFPEHAEAIQSCTSPHGVEQHGHGDMVKVWEAWHLPSSRSSSDGLHCIVLDGGAELLCEEWKLSRFPFVLFNFKPRLLGFWGQGVAELLTGIQIELNRLVRSISEQLRRKGRGRTWVPIASKVPSAQLTNGIGDIMYYHGNVPPTVDSGNAVAQEEFMQIDRLYQKAFQLVGVSELSVSAKKPSGLDAGVAIREFEEIESERFAKQHQRWDAFHVELAETWLDFVRTFGGKNYVTRYEHKRYMESITAADVMMEPGEYAIHAMPSSNLPQTPAARRQAVKELQADGFIDRATAQKLLDYPDLEAEANLGNAARDDVDAIIDRALNGTGAVEMPDRYTNLDMFVERGTAAYLFARNHGADEKRLELLSTLIDGAAEQSLAAKMPPPMPGSPPDMSAPGDRPPGGPNINVAGAQLNMPATPTVPPLIA